MNYFIAREAIGLLPDISAERYFLAVLGEEDAFLKKILCRRGGRIREIFPGRRSCPLPDQPELRRLQSLPPGEFRPLRKSDFRRLSDVLGNFRRNLRPEKIYYLEETRYICLRKGIPGRYDVQEGRISLPSLRAGYYDYLARKKSRLLQGTRESVVPPDAGEEIFIYGAVAADLLAFRHHLRLTGARLVLPKPEQPLIPVLPSRYLVIDNLTDRAGGGFARDLQLPENFRLIRGSFSSDRMADMLRSISPRDAVIYCGHGRSSTAGVPALEWKTRDGWFRFEKNLSLYVHLACLESEFLFTMFPFRTGILPDSLLPEGDYSEQLQSLVWAAENGINAEIMFRRRERIWRHFDLWC